MSVTPETVISLQEQKNIILNILFDACSDGETLVSYLEHVGFDACAIRNVSELPSAFLGYYRLKTGHYDVNRACHHLATWPPIAAQIAELRRERDET